MTAAMISTLPASWRRVLPLIAMTLYLASISECGDCRSRTPREVDMQFDLPSADGRPGVGHRMHRLASKLLTNVTDDEPAAMTRGPGDRAPRDGERVSIWH